VPFILVFMLPPTGSFIRFFATVGLPGVSDVLTRWSGFDVEYGMFVAGLLFLVASLTDLLDGAIARRRGIVTNLGRFLDPIADKVLVSSVLIALVRLDRVGALAVILILLREFVVSALRMVASDKGVVISASGLGKAKTVSQIVAILVVMFQELAFPEILVPVGQVAMTVAVLLTLYSGYDYLARHMAHLREM
jgi:CDP-diacylglycerol--glycerol-3-phosphate 3-phosphatidyltransferase